MLIPIISLLWFFPSLLTAESTFPEGGEYTIWNSAPQYSRIVATVGEHWYDAWADKEKPQWSWTSSQMNEAKEKDQKWLKQPFVWRVYDNTTDPEKWGQLPDSDIVWIFNCEYRMSTDLPKDEGTKFSLTTQVEEPYCKPSYTGSTYSDMVKTAYVICTVGDCRHEKCKGQEIPTWDEGDLKEYAKNHD